MRPLLRFSLPGIPSVPIQVKIVTFIVTFEVLVLMLMLMLSRRA